MAPRPGPRQVVAITGTDTAAGEMKPDEGQAKEDPRAHLERLRRQPVAEAAAALHD